MRNQVRWTLAAALILGSCLAVFWKKNQLEQNAPTSGGAATSTVGIRTRAEKDGAPAAGSASSARNSHEIRTGRADQARAARSCAGVKFLTRDELLQLTSWLANHSSGFWSLRTQYEQLTDAELAEREAQTDALAAEILTQRKLDSYSPYVITLRQGINAATLGSVAALRDLAAAEAREYRTSIDEGNFEEATEHAVSSQAWKATANRRAKESSEDPPSRIYSTLDTLPSDVEKAVRLSQRVKDFDSEVRLRADSYYDMLITERLHKGLSGAFDDSRSPPPSMSKVATSASQLSALSDAELVDAIAEACDSESSAKEEVN